MTAELQRFIDETIAQVVIAADDFRDEEVDALVASLDARTRHDVTLALAMRLQLVAELDKIHESSRARQELRSALALPLQVEQRLKLLLDLAARRYGPPDTDDERADVAQLVPLLEAPEAPLDLRIRAHLEVAKSQRPPIAQHVVRAAELAAETKDVALKRQAMLFHAEHLFDAGELERAAALVRSAPASSVPEEEGGGLDARAFLEHVERKSGRASEPSGEAFAELPRGEHAADPHLAQLRACFTHGADELELIRQRVPMSPETIRVWSHGRVTSPAELESQKIFGPVRSHACGCGRFLGNVYAGLVCHKCGVEVISRETRSYRPAHLTLSKPVVHPWFIASAARVLDVTQPALRASDATELQEQLRHVFLPELAESLRRELEWTTSQVKRASLMPRLATVETLEEAGVRPEWLVLELLPVWPPEAQLPAPLDRAAVRSCYVEVLEAADPTPAVRRLFNLFAKTRT